jgi:hypothetical protein
MSLANARIHEMVGASNDEWDRSRLKAELRAEFVGLVGGYARLIPLPVIPSLFFWIWLDNRVDETTRVIVVTSISLAMGLLFVWSFVHMWKSNSRFIRDKHKGTNTPGGSNPNNPGNR